MTKPIETTWHGGDSLPDGCLVTILAVDHEDPAVPGRRACWVRHWPEGDRTPVYRSCDLDDLGLTDEQMEAILGDTP